MKERKEPLFFPFYKNRIIANIGGQAEFQGLVMDE